MGTVTVPVDSTLSWSCPSCGSGNYQILNGAGDTSIIAVNGLNQTDGKTVITAGTYHAVTVNTEGQDWAFTITSGNSTQTQQAPPAVPNQTAPTQTVPPPTSSQGNLTACDQNISAGPATSCPFAESVFIAYAADYKANGQQSSDTVTAYSPVTRQSYAMSCTTDGVTVSCAGGNNAFVTYPLRAVVVYSP